MQAQKDVYIAYAAAPGRVAYAGAHELSPFTEFFVKYLPTPGLELDDLLRRVREEVRVDTQEKQIPWSNSAVGKVDFFFKPRSYAPMAKLALLGFATGVLSVLASAFVAYLGEKQIAAYLPGIILALLLSISIYQWGASPGGASPRRCLLSFALAALAWIGLVYTSEFIESKFFPLASVPTTASSPISLSQMCFYGLWVCPKETEPLRSPEQMMQDLRGKLGTLEPLHEVALRDHVIEVTRLWNAYKDLLHSYNDLLGSSKAAHAPFS